MHYYQHHIGDYAQATAHLSMLEDAAYSRMLRWYYAEEKPLPADLRAVCRIVRAASKQEREAVESVLSEFFELRDDGYHQTRADAEIVQFLVKQDKARASAKARWDKEHAQSEGNANAYANASETDANALRTQCEGNAPINQEPIERDKTATTARPRGTRLPTGWAPSDDLLHWTRTEKPGIDPLQTLEKFRDHWAAQPGQKGVKTDWDATWRNWVRNEIPRAGGLPANGQRFVPV